jgi:hypothetical protein
MEVPDDVWVSFSCSHGCNVLRVELAIVVECIESVQWKDSSVLVSRLFLVRQYPRFKGNVWLSNYLGNVMLGSDCDDLTSATAAAVDPLSPSKAKLPLYLKYLAGNVLCNVARNGSARESLFVKACGFFQAINNILLCYAMYCKAGRLSRL